MKALRRVRTQRNESGASVVEVALVMPFVILITLAAIDGAVLFSSYASVGDAAKSAARSASASSDDVAADHNTLEEIVDADEEMTSGHISRVIIFRAADYDSTAPNGCVQSGASNFGLKCNVYDAGDFAAPAERFRDPAWKNWKGWPPGDRAVSRSAGVDLAGVAVEAEIRTPTGVFGRKTFTVTRTMVLPIEARSA